MISWIDTITNVSEVAAKRRLTYLGDSPKHQLPDHIIDPAGTDDPSAGGCCFDPRDQTNGTLDETLPTGLWCGTGILA